jgi:predicted nucleotide-binding protein
MENQRLTLSTTKQEFKTKITNAIKKGYELLKEFPGEKRSIIDSEDILKANYKKWNKFNRDLLEYSFTNPKNKYLNEYENLDLVDISDNTNTVLLYKKCIEEEISILEGFIDRIDLVPENSEGVEISSSPSKALLSNNIFIVHGHNEAIKEKVAHVITKLGLTPIILHEKPNGGKTIIEKFEANSSEAQYAIILLTADDEGGTKGSGDLKSRARQNVVFEMGYFMGKLGRNRVFPLLEDGVEKPGDLDGIVYTLIDSAGAWKIELVRELNGCGYNVDANNIFK